MEQRKIMSYADFKNAINESKIDEGKVGETIKKALKKIKEFFIGTGSQFLNCLLLQDKNDLPSGITYIPSASDIEALAEHGDKIDTAITLKEGFVSKYKNGILESENEEDLLTRNFENMFMATFEDEKLELDYTNQAIDKQGIGTVPNVSGKILQAKINLYINAIQKGNTKIAPIHIWGAPGIGKTEIVTSIAAHKWKFFEEDDRMIVIDLRSKNAEDFFLPYIKEEKGTKGEYKSSSSAKTDLLPLYHAHEGEAGNDRVNGEDGRGGILFFDEMARADETVKNAIMTLFDNTRSVGNWKLGSKWSLLACSNRQDDEDGNTFNWNTAISARFQHYNYSPKFADWEKWALTAKHKVKNAEGEEVESLIVHPHILQFVKYWGADAATFKHGGGKYFFAGYKGQATSANPRNWARASQNYIEQMEEIQKFGKGKGEYTKEEYNDLIETSVSSLVGEEAAREFVNFVNMVEMIPLEEVDLVYTNPAKAPSLTDLEGKLAGKSSEVALRKVAFMMLVSAHKAGNVLTEDECTNVIDWLVAQKDNQQVMPFWTNFSENVHPYLDEDYQVELGTSEEVKKVEAKDPHVREKIKMNDYFWANTPKSPGNKLADGYPDIFQ